LLLAVGHARGLDRTIAPAWHVSMAALLLALHMDCHSCTSCGFLARTSISVSARSKTCKVLQFDCALCFNVGVVLKTCLLPGSSVPQWRAARL